MIEKKTKIFFILSRSINFKNINKKIRITKEAIDDCPYLYSGNLKNQSKDKIKDKNIQ